MNDLTCHLNQEIDKVKSELKTHLSACTAQPHEVAPAVTSGTTLSTTVNKGPTTAKKLPQPFKYRGAWRAQMTCKNGTRPTADFEKLNDANDRIVATSANNKSEHEPELGGPTPATLAQALNHYTGLYTIVKGGIEAHLEQFASGVRHA